ncbi:hypothetical protein [Bosea thiooxidans]
MDDDTQVLAGLATLLAAWGYDFFWAVEELCDAIRRPAPGRSI